ncbi:MAG: hypothetical protein JWM80_88 [Cyanobacteria bacterium RYN_339]|nr:hypothetical protein [Cyanobacteria bacterium RYN_339]
MVESLKLDPDGAELPPRQRAMVDYALKLTRTPWAAREGDVDGLRAVGFDDLGILHIVTFTGWFNYINRVADGLGVELDQETWEALCKGEPIPWEAESGSTRPKGALPPAPQPSGGE